MSFAPSFKHGTITPILKKTYSVGVRQGCLLSPTVFNIFLEKKIMQDTLNNYTSTIAVVGYNICNLMFADYIDVMAGSIPELQLLKYRQII